MRNERSTNLIFPPNISAYIKNIYKTKQRLQGGSVRRAIADVEKHMSEEKFRELNAKFGYVVIKCDRNYIIIFTVH